MPNPHRINFNRNLRVEIEVTPNWWSWWSTVGGFNLGFNLSDDALLMGAASLRLAIMAFNTCEVHVTPTTLRLTVLVPRDEGITVAVMCEKAEQLRDQLNALKGQYLGVK